MFVSRNGNALEIRVTPSLTKSSGAGLSPREKWIEGRGKARLACLVHGNGIQTRDAESLSLSPFGVEGATVCRCITRCRETRRSRLPSSPPFPAVGVQVRPLSPCS